MTVSLCVRFIFVYFFYLGFFFFPPLALSVISLLHCRSLSVPSSVKRLRDEAGETYMWGFVIEIICSFITSLLKCAYHFSSCGSR